MEENSSKPATGVGLGAVLIMIAAGTLLFAWSHLQKPSVPYSPPDRSQGADPTNAASVSWTQFRGPLQGHGGDAAGLPLIWSERTNVIWKTEIAGTGWSSPVVSSTMIWVTSALQDGRSLRALGFDNKTGALLLEREVINVSESSAKHAVNSHASPTPALESNRLFVAFGRHGMACLNTENGNVLWKNTALKFDDESMGGGASPILTQDHVVIHCDGTDERFIVALDKTTGVVAWKTPRSNPIKQATPYRKAFSTPVLHALNGVEQLISSSSYRVFGYDPKTGKELWSADTPGFCPVPVPLVENDWIFACAGFDKAHLLAFRKEADKPPQLVWKTMRSVSLVPSPVLVDQYIYMVSDGGIASCVEASTGRSVWNERITGKYWASVLHADGRIHCFAEDGTTTVLAALPEFKVLARNKLEGEIVATPAIADHGLVIRTKTHLYRVATVQTK